MLLDSINKFFKNELLGIRQALWNKFVNPIIEIRNDIQNTTEELTKEKYPHEVNTINAISEKTGITPKNILLVGNEQNTVGTAICKSSNILIGKGCLSDDKLFAGTYTHELGHLKYGKLHSKLTIGYAKIPYKLLFEATTTLYGLGVSAYAFMGNNKALDYANTLFSHSGKYLVGAIVLNSIFNRTREYMADNFAYNHTGILPSEYLPSIKRNGIIGNASKIAGDIINTVKSGYPSTIERDFVAKIIGKKPIDTNFVERAKKGKTENIEIQK